MLHLQAKALRFREKAQSPLVRDEGVGGSNPLTPTNKINDLQTNDRKYVASATGRGTGVMQLTMGTRDEHYQNNS